MGRMITRPSLSGEFPSTIIPCFVVGGVCLHVMLVIVTVLGRGGFRAMTPARAETQVSFLPGLHCSFVSLLEYFFLLKLTLNENIV